MERAFLKAIEDLPVKMKRVQLQLKMMVNNLISLMDVLRYSSSYVCPISSMLNNTRRCSLHKAFQTRIELLSANELASKKQNKKTTRPCRNNFDPSSDPCNKSRLKLLLARHSSRVNESGTREGYWLLLILETVQEEREKHTKIKLKSLLCTHTHTETISIETEWKTMPSLLDMMGWWVSVWRGRKPHAIDW